MKLKSLVLISSLVLFGQALIAGTAGVSEPKQSKFDDLFGQSAIELLYGYTDFNFNSTTPNNYNRFEGSSNLYAAGSDQIKINKNLYAGLYLFKIDTGFNSQILLAPSTPSVTAQNMNNTTLYGHLRQAIGPKMSIDAGGAYGFNKVHVQSVVLLGTTDVTPGFANYSNNNWFSSFNLLYRNTWKKLIFSAAVGGLYTQINTGSYVMNFSTLIPSQLILPIVNKSTLILENAELAYPVNDYLMPFVNGGLIQVAYYRNSRPILATPINGSLPQLDMNKNAFRVGGGLLLRHKQFNVRLEEKYYNAGSTFVSYQTMVSLEYQFS